jgi:hypothetical protein
MARSFRFDRASLTLLGATALVFVAACGGFSEEEAIERCDQEQAARGAEACFNDVTYDQCVAAYEECGSDVEVAESCPPQYLCPE